MNLLKQVEELVGKAVCNLSIKIGSYQMIYYFFLSSTDKDKIIHSNAVFSRLSPPYAEDLKPHYQFSSKDEQRSQLIGVLKEPVSFRKAYRADDKTLDTYKTTQPLQVQVSYFSCSVTSGEKAYFFLYCTKC